MTNYIIYTDGSCRANGNGGLGIVWLKNGKKILEYSKGYKKVTNNIMELKAIGIALKSIKKPIDSLTIISDSEYALGCIFNDSWNPKKNKELINSIKKELKRVKTLTTVEYKHIYGHQKHGGEDMVWNNYVDKLASNESSMIL